MNRQWHSLLLLAALGLGVSSCHEEDAAPAASLAPIAEPTHAYAEVVAGLRAADDVDGAYVRGAFRYYTRHDDKGGRVWARAPLYGSGAEQILLTERDVGDGSLGSLEVSPNDKWIAFTARPMSVDRYAVHIKDLKTGEIVAPVVSGADFSLAWGDDDNLFYSKLDRKNRPAQVYALRPHSRRLPKLIHEEKERDHEVMVGAAEQGPALFVRSPSSILGYRLNPLGDVEPTRGDLEPDTAPAHASTASAASAANASASVTADAAVTPSTTPTATSQPVDGGGGGGSLGGSDDPAAHRPAVR